MRRVRTGKIYAAGNRQFFCIALVKKAQVEVEDVWFDTAAGVTTWRYRD